MSNGKKLTPDEVQQIAAMRAAGWTLAMIADRLGVGIATVQRALKRHPVRPGEAQAELIELARADLARQYTDDEGIRDLYVELIADTASHIRLARQKATEALEHLTPTDTKSAALTMRALAGHATATKIHADTVRTLAPRPIDEAKLPELIIRSLTADDLERLRLEQSASLEELGVTDSNDAIVEETSSND